MSAHAVTRPPTTRTNGVDLSAATPSTSAAASPFDMPCACGRRVSATPQVIEALQAHQETPEHRAWRSAQVDDE